MKYAVLLLSFALALAGCAKKPVIKEGSSVKINYTLKVDGEVVDSSEGREPYAFVQGQHEVVPGLEEQLVGLKVGDQRTITVTPEKGYGTSNPAAVQDVPRAAFGDADSLKPGDIVRGNSGGREFAARVVEITSDTIKLDMNHPLAGKTLVFDITVIEVLEAGKETAKS
jgi:FKBP-type peptidyl-prolyl cis-trans isomerase SlyD